MCVRACTAADLVREMLPREQKITNVSCLNTNKIAEKSILHTFHMYSPRFISCFSLSGGTLNSRMCLCCWQFYFTTCYVTAISTFAYYAMLSGQGWLITPNCRQLFYVRYLDWFVTTPLILLDLGMIAGADTGLLAAVAGADMLMIFGGFMASVSSGHIKWLWFVLSLMVFAPLVFVMVRGYRTMVERLHPAVVEIYSKVSWITAITWSLYPVVFIFSEGTGDWSPNFEIMMYGVLDILSKAVFGFILLLSHEVGPLFFRAGPDTTLLLSPFDLCGSHLPACVGKC